MNKTGNVMLDKQREGEAQMSPPSASVGSASDGHVTLNEDDIRAEFKLTNAVMAYSEVMSPGISSRILAIDLMAIMQGTVRSISNLMIDGRRLISGKSLPEIKVGPNPNILNQAFQVVGNCAPLMELIKMGGSQATKSTTSQKVNSADKVKKDKKSKNPSAAKTSPTGKTGNPITIEKTLEDKIRMNLRQKCHRSIKSEKMQVICKAFGLTKDSIFKKIQQLTSAELKTVEDARKLSGTLPLEALGLINSEKISKAVADGILPEGWALATDLHDLKAAASLKSEQAQSKKKYEIVDLFDAYSIEGSTLENVMSVESTKGGFIVALNHYVIDRLDLPNQDVENRTILSIGKQQIDKSYPLTFDIKSNSKASSCNHFKCVAALTLEKSASNSSLSNPNVVRLRITDKGKNYLPNPMSFEEVLDANALGVFLTKVKKTPAASATVSVGSKEKPVPPKREVTSESKVQTEKSKKDNRIGSSGKTSAELLRKQRVRDAAALILVQKQKAEAEKKFLSQPKPNTPRK